MVKRLLGLRIFALLLFLVLGLGTLQAQTARLSGRITDQYGMPVAYANVIAQAAHDTTRRVFSVTDQKGRYKLTLSIDSLYVITIGHLGFKRLKDTLQITQDTHKNYKIQQVSIRLQKVVIKDLPVTVLDNKVIYKADAFRNGNERVLYGLLKKMPGIRVDRKGHISFNGKMVRGLTIGGHRFFTGETSLGVFNIPADAIKDIVIEKNHHQIGMLDDVDDQGTTSINIVLKKGHKKFSFGESKLGGGIKDRYLINPKIFYYSPNTSVNFIGNLNNTGQLDYQGFTMQNFMSGFRGLKHHDHSFRMLHQGLTGFLASGNHTFRKTLFGAGNINQKIAKYWRMNVTSFNKQGKTQQHRTLHNQYLSQGKTDEIRDFKNEHQLFYTKNKIRFKYDNLNDAEMLIALIYKHAQGNGYDLKHSKSQDSSRFFRTDRQPAISNFIGTLSYNKRFNYHHLLTLNADFDYYENKNTEDWLFDQPVFNNLIPFQPQNNGYNFFNQTALNSRTYRLDGKLYWIINRTNQLYPEAGINYLNTHFNTLALQKLPDGSRHSFHDAGFDNQLQFQLRDVFAGLTYKVMFGKLIFHAGALAHQYHWRVYQFDTAQVNDQKIVVLPFFRATYKFSNSEKLKFKYHIASNFADAQDFADRYQLMNFNSIYRGNVRLENELSHDFSLNFNRTNFYNGMSYHAMVDYRHQVSAVKNKTTLQGIDFVNTSEMSHLPRNQWSLIFGTGKTMGNFNISLDGNASLSHYQQNINEENISYKSQQYGYTLGLNYDKKGRRYSDKPNGLWFDFKFRQNFSRFSSDKGDETRFMSLNPSLDFNARFLKKFVFKMQYGLTYYANQTAHKSRTYDRGSGSLFYKQEDKPWGIAVKVYNLFDIRYRRRHSTDAFMISDQKVFIQPRTVMLILSYKL